MLFKAPVLDAIARGEVTLAFRRWRRPTVKPGGTLTTPVGVLAIESVEAIDPDAITADDARLAGYADANGARQALSVAGEVYRIAFRLAGADPRHAIRDDVGGLDEVRIRLGRLDARGAWTRTTLQIIASSPGVRAPDLAARLGRETAAFKSDVRKLKAMGLTVSLQVGYRLSPRGEALLAGEEGA